MNSHPDFGSSPPPRASSQWTAEDAAKYMSVRYVSAPYGPGMLGETVHKAYLNLLHQQAARYTQTCQTTRSFRGPGHISAGIANPASPSWQKRHSNTGFRIKLEHFQNLFEVMREVSDVRVTSKGIEYLGQENPWKRRKQEEQEHEDKPPWHYHALQMMERCFANLKGRIMDLDEHRVEYSTDFYREMLKRYDRIEKFMNGIAKLLQHSAAVSSLVKIDEGFFTSLFIDFAWIFNVQFRLVTALELPLIVCGQEVSSVPDLVYVLYAPNSVILLVITVAEDAAPKTKVDRPYNLKEKEKKHKCSDPSVQEMCVREPDENEDSTYLPEDLRGQHACQLVRALPYTHAPNKNCMLGLIVQGTQVRLTSLVMEQDHLANLAHQDFNPADYDASVYFTRAYDMLNVEDRNHLGHIMVTLASLEGD